MKKRFVNSVLIFILLAFTILSNANPALAAPAAEGITTPQEMETFLDGVINQQITTNHIPGAVVTVVRDGDVFFAKGYGYADLENQLPVSPARTLFRIGSVSKLFTATAVMQLAEQGKLDLNADVNTYLDFQIPATYPEPITLQNLLTHTPGFEESNIGIFASTPDQLNLLGSYLKLNIPARVFPPGKVGAYSNYGMALAGYIVERVSGKPLADYVEENIFSPLDMNHSTFLQPVPADLAPDLANGYIYFEGKHQLGKFELVRAYPSGAISATADDMAKFMIAHLQNGSYGDARILSDAAAQQMHGPLSLFDPRLKEGAAYGFARIHSNGQLDLWHNGDTFLFHTGLHLLPEQNLGFFISNNGSEGSGLEAAVYKAFMDHYFSTQTEQEPVPPSNMASRAAQYAGEYYSSRANFTGIEKIMGLFAHAQISVDADGYVLIPSQGGAKKAVEVEPGLLQSVDDPWKQIVMETNAKGQNYLTAGTASLIKARWYETQAFHFSVLGISLLVLLFTLIGWVVASIVRRIKKREPQSLLPRLARNNGVAFILLMVAFIIGLIVVLSKSDPALGIPLFLFEVPVGLRYVLIIPFIAVMAGIGMLGFSALAWIKHFWTLVGRLHYTLATLAAWAMLLELVYWNFLKL